MSTGALGRRTTVSADRVVAWLMMMLLFASVTIAVYDLYLLVAAIR